MSTTDKLIFVIEPNDKVARKTVTALAKVGYEVKRIKEAQEAIGLINELQPDLITFSGPNGHSLARYLKDLSDSSKIPIIRIRLLDEPEPKSVDIPWLLSVISNAFAAAELPP